MNFFFTFKNNFSSLWHIILNILLFNLVYNIKCVNTFLEKFSKLKIF
jgi:hypothetical protein